MNKIFALMLTAVFALTGVAAMNTADPAAVEETTVEVESYVAAGTVIEITDDYVVFTASDGQVFQANITHLGLVGFLPGPADPGTVTLCIGGRQSLFGLLCVILPGCTGSQHHRRKQDKSNA